MKPKRRFNDWDQDKILFWFCVLMFALAVLIPDALR